MKIQDLRNIVKNRIAELDDVEQMTMQGESSDPFDRLYNTGYFACLDCERDWLRGFLRDIDKVENPDHFPDLTKMVCADCADCANRNSDSFDDPCHGCSDGDRYEPIKQIDNGQD